jgi:hypothetical protein
MRVFGAFFQVSPAMDPPEIGLACCCVTGGAKIAGKGHKSSVAADYCNPEPKSQDAKPRV